VRRPLTVLAATTVVGASSLVLTATPAQAVDQVNTQRLREAVTVSGILGHERVLQRIANENDGNRASGTSGYMYSANYVKQTLKAAGYQVKSQYFRFPFYDELAAPSLSQVSPTAADYETATLEYSGTGSVTGKVVPTKDVTVPPAAEPSSTTSGCEAADFVKASSSAPQVALVQRGFCTFEEKAANAQAAGYDAVVIFNEGQEGRTELLSGTLGRAFTLPVVGLSYADGRALYNATRAGTVTVQVSTSTENRPGALTRNVIAETPGGNPDKVLVVGAHLDSVGDGPGINDNGSGTATILEIAEQMAHLGITPRQKVRFAFWGAEENGLLGSQHYVDSLSDAGVSKIFANLNFDMLGSPNFARFVYDGDGSASTPGPAGSGQIEKLFTSYLTGQGLSSEPTPFDGRSDYGAFIDIGIPAGGLFSGAEGVKTAAQAKKFGGTAGEAYDPCYHQACDTIANLSTKALFQLGDAAAHATMTLATTRTGFFEDGSLRTSQARTSPSRQYDFRGPHALR